MTLFLAVGCASEIVDLAELEPELIPDNLRVSPQGGARVQQRFRCRRLAHLLLARLLAQANLPLSLLQDTARSPSGRPYFGDSKIDFNISHSGDWVAVLLQIGNGAAVGVDLEVPKARRFRDLLAHFAPKAEVAWFDEQEHPESAFFRTWCLREAVLKSQGVGIVALSEVRHWPEKWQLFSAHCPPGRLVFVEKTADLPFYLAAFSNSAEPIQFFAWQNGALQPREFPHSLIYQVN